MSRKFLSLKGINMTLKIAISSGKGGTGKTLIATNIARAIEQKGLKINYLDCDVEAPNGHLFLKPEFEQKTAVCLNSPVGIDTDECTGCGKCVDVCRYNALASVNTKILFFPTMCHMCGACQLVCPFNAITEGNREIGELIIARSGQINLTYGLLKTGEAGMSPRLIRKVKENLCDGINILDSPPGTACPVVETVRDVDLCVLISDSTPFGIHDLKLSVSMCRELNQEPVVVINRARGSNDDLISYCHDASVGIIGEIPDDRSIAECYSDGNLIIDNLPNYQSAFTKLAGKILYRASLAPPAKKNVRDIFPGEPANIPQESGFNGEGPAEKTKEIVVISGKGGTGKTSIAACFSTLDPKMAIADCDVDASDLHLILQPEIMLTGSFSGGDLATIDTDKCTLCDKCRDACHFDAIRRTSEHEQTAYNVAPLQCEGCGVCALVCPAEAVQLEAAINGNWFISRTRFGPMSHARLGIAEENSGRLVSLVRRNKDKLAQLNGLNEGLIDGSPGTGCPVVASITAAEYAIIVTEPTVSGIHDMIRILELIEHFDVPGGLIINKFDLNQSRSNEIKQIAEKRDVKILGMLPYDERFTEAQFKGLSLIEYAEDDLTHEIHQIWNEVKMITESINVS